MDDLAALPLFSTTASVSQPVKAAQAAPLDFLSDIRTFREFGTETVNITDGGIPYFVNEFWTAGQRQSHSIHEISYRACFKAQLPAFFISRLTRPDDRVYDPFMGRGTTLVEAALLGRRVAGNDINPLSKLLVRPRLKPLSLSAVAQVLDRVPWRQGVIEHPDLLVFFSENTLRQISALRRWLIDNAGNDRDVDPAADWVRMIALNRLTGHSPGFFSVYTLPPNQAVSVKAQMKINEKRSQVPPDRDVKAIILKKTRTLLSDGGQRESADAILSTASADDARDIPAQSVDLVVTSPPFLDIVQYAEDNWLRCWFADIDLSTVRIAHHRTEANWSEMVRRTLIDLARIVKPGGHVAFEVGEVRKGKVLLERLVWQAAEGLPFEKLFVVVNSQEFTKTANCWGVSNNSGGTNTNRIVMLKRRKD
ncbi:MAG: site-specific DNA-methyltransferase [Methylobacterium sp.]|nr:site-specific DNA-methyltransferase [Methylobacterium sp.]MCA3604211.1 site-specific DNA-methyltransferase [Methylobacterium sp.]MCA3614316.1 site-specific DNA-methyltransferase [Methylobacterium sp.]